MVWSGSSTNTRSPVILILAMHPSALARRDERTMLVFEDLGGEPPDRLLGGPLEISKLLRIAIPLADTLRRVHERGRVRKPAQLKSISSKCLSPKSATLTRDQADVRVWSS
jgi:hypothetical protein